MRFLRVWISWAIKGGLWAAISYRTQPSDQISHLPLQGRSDHTSGLAQQGVPVWVTASPLLLILLTFMSARRVYRQCLVSRMLALLMSRWKMFMRCRVFRACSSWMASRQIQDQGTVSLRFWQLFISEHRSPPQANSVISSRALQPSSQVASLQARMQGLVMEARILTSLRVLVTSRVLVWPSLIFFMAQIQPSSFLLTLQTLAKAPSPTLQITSKFCISLIKNKFLFLLQPPRYHPFHPHPFHPHITILRCHQPSPCV